MDERIAGLQVQATQLERRLSDARAHLSRELNRTFDSLHKDLRSLQVSIRELRDLHAQLTPPNGTPPDLAPASPGDGAA